MASIIPSDIRRLRGVDGLRGAAALAVVLFHIHWLSGVHLPVPGADFALAHGWAGVSLFLVLSGFCLYLPFAAGRNDRFRVAAFLVRRCRRLLPAYYGSLLLVLAADLTVGPALHETRSGSELAWQVLSHVTLTHTLFPSTFHALNGVYWSLGLEWQLYLGLPLLILLARRAGLLATVVGVLGVNVLYVTLVQSITAIGLVTRGSTLAGDVLPNLMPGRWTEFALGMLAAELYVSGRLASLAQKLKLALVPLLLAGLVADGQPLRDIALGAGFFCLLGVVLTRGEPVAALFAWRPLAWVGTVSYSLYLVHLPMLQLLSRLLAGHRLSPFGVAGLMMLSLPAVLAAACILFMVLERPTLVWRQRPEPSLPASRTVPTLEVGT